MCNFCGVSCVLVYGCAEIRPDERARQARAHGGDISGTDRGCRCLGRALSGVRACDFPLLRDADAWGELYREYAPAIFRFCRRALPTREDAEDATMDIFAKLMRDNRLQQYDQSRSFTAWLYKVAANHCWDVLRRRKTRQDKETEDLENVPLEHPDPNQLDRLIEQKTSEEVRRALDKLGSRARMALVMRYYSDMSYDEIADALGVRRAFVGVVLLRARHELRQALGQSGALAAGGTT